MRVGVIGAGTIFDTHAQALSEIGHPVQAVVDVDRGRAAAAAARHQVPTVGCDWRELLDRSEVDIIDVCTPPSFHAEIVIAALRAGKHVICEKPLAPNLAAVDEILWVQENSWAKLLVIHQLRFHPLHQRMKWLIEHHHLGQVCLARCLRYDPPPSALVKRGDWGNWELTGGGVLMTKAIHQLDLLCWLLGRPKRVQAMMGTFLVPIESEDHVVANIEFVGGALASLVVSGASHLYAEHLDLIGELGMVASPWRLHLADREREKTLGRELQQRFPLTPDPRWRRILRRLGLNLSGTPVGNLHAPIFRAFLHSIKYGSPVPVSAQEARTAIELCTAIYASALTRAAVELPLDRTNTFYNGVKKSDYHCTTAP